MLPFCHKFPTLTPIVRYADARNDGGGAGPTGYSVLLSSRLAFLAEIPDTSSPKGRSLSLTKTGARLPICSLKVPTRRTAI